jgi:hypothetical protein
VVWSAMIKTWLEGMHLHCNLDQSYPGCVRYRQDVHCRYLIDPGRIASRVEQGTGADASLSFEAIAWSPLHRRQSCYCWKPFVLKSRLRSWFLCLKMPCRTNYSRNTRLVAKAWVIHEREIWGTRRSCTLGPDIYVPKLTPKGYGKPRLSAGLEA